MSFNHIAYQAQFLADHKGGIFTNDTGDVVKMERSVVTPCFRCIGIHHLTPSENVGKHNVFLDVIDLAGKRLDERIEWGWKEMNSWESPASVVLDKPPYEPGGNIAVDWGQIVWVRVLGEASDLVSGLTTQLPDEGRWNTLGHHSYYVVFAYDDSGTVTPPVDPPPVTGDCTELQAKYDATLAVIAKIRELVK